MADDEPPPLVDSDTSDDDDDTMPPLDHVSRIPPQQTRVIPETRETVKYPQVPKGLSKAKTEEVRRALDVASQWGAQMSQQPGELLAQHGQLKDFNKQLVESIHKSREDFDRCQKQLRSQERAIATHAEALARHEPKMNELRVNLRGKEKKITKCIQDVTEALTARDQAQAEKRQLQASLKQVTDEAQRDKASLEQASQQASHEISRLSRQCELFTETEQRIRQDHTSAIEQVRLEAARDLTQLKHRFQKLQEHERSAQANLLQVNELLKSATPEMRSRTVNETIHRLADPLEECAVCFENHVQGVVLLPCLHKEICLTCVQDVLELKSEPLCPVCQTPIGRVVQIDHCFDSVLSGSS